MTTYQSLSVHEKINLKSWDIFAEKRMSKVGHSLVDRSTIIQQIKTPNFIY